MPTDNINPQGGPLLNCAADICCPPPKALRSRAEILCNLGVSDEHAPAMAAKMREQGIAFAPVKLMDAIAELVDHPGRHETD